MKANENLIYFAFRMNKKKANCWKKEAKDTFSFEPRQSKEFNNKFIQFASIIKGMFGGLFLSTKKKLPETQVQQFYCMHQQQHHAKGVVCTISMALHKKLEFVQSFKRLLSQNAELCDDN